MAVTTTKLNLNARGLAKEIGVEVTITNKRIFKFGLLFIRLGCFISGLRYIEKE